MKLRNIFTALAVAALTFVGCQEEDRFLDEVQVSQSLVTLDVNGGSADITVTATADWKIAEVKDVWPEVVTRDENGNVTATAPSWLKANVTSGAAGETKVTFSAEATTETRELVLNLECAGATQQLRVLQMAEKIETPMSTCAQVIAGEDGKIYRIKGVCTSIANTVYGNWYIDDGTGVVYVYGTLYQGATKQFEKHGLEVGDIVTIEGPRKDYSGTIEMIDVTVLDIEKSLIKVEKVLPEGPISLEGGKTTAILTVKDGDFSVVIPEDASWLTAGEPYTVGTSTFVDLTAAPNEGGARKTTVTFKTKVGEKEYVAMADIEQEGAIAAVTVADFLAAAEGTALYELTGIVKNLKNTTYGNFDLVDATGSVYVYGLTNNGAIGSNDKKFAELGINEGDVVTIIGTRASYNGTAQVGGTAYLKEHVVAAKVATVTEFLAESKGTWCKVTGTIANLVSDVYGNFDLVGEDGASVYVYGLTSSYVVKNDKSFANLGLKEGDIVTLVGKRDVYNNQDQVGGPAYYISHETPAEGGDDNTGDNPGDEGTETFASNVTFGTVSSAYTDNKVNVNGVENVANLKLGTSSKFGEGTVTLPAGTKKVTYYSVAWKDKPSKLEFSVAGTVIGTQEVAANEAAANQAPYNLTVTDSDKYTFTLPAALEAETVVTVKTVETGKRAFIFGVIAE